jgi:hypothetical protein
LKGFFVFLIIVWNLKKSSDDPNVLLSNGEKLLKGLTIWD